MAIYVHFKILYFDNNVISHSSYCSNPVIIIYRGKKEIAVLIYVVLIQKEERVHEIRDREERQGKSQHCFRTFL